MAKHFANVTEDKKESIPNSDHSCINNNWKHVIMMMACCLAPVGAALVLTYIGYTGVGSYLLFLLCPIMHIFMMRNMNKGQKKCH